VASRLEWAKEIRNKFDGSKMATQSHPGSSSPLARLPLLRTLAENWWLLLLRGVASIAFGVLAFVWPGLTLVALIFLWGAYAVVDGGIALWAAISGKGGEIAPRWWLAIVGIVGLLAGLVAFASPGLTGLVLLMFIAGWAIVIGAFEMWGAIQLRKEIEGEWWLILSGLLSVAFGVLLFARPGAGALGLVWLIGSFAILHGCTLIALSFRLKQFRPE
jgi:uncharacterized membrane protein HdeD (DUF308 family)